MLSVTHLVSFVVILVESGGVSVHNPFYCFSQDPIKPQIGMFSTISAYETTRGRTINPNVSTCNPTKFWMISRHGTRLPSIADITRMREHNERLQREVLQHCDQGKASLCASDVALLRNWKLDPNMTIEVEQSLTSSGWDELEGLAKRYQSAFPSILPSTYSPQNYFFRTTKYQRARDSLRAFADGLFGVNGSKQAQFEDIPVEDYLLDPNNLCPIWSNITANILEYIAFIEGSEYQEMTSQISAKLGFHWSHALSNTEIQVLYETCRFEQIWDLDSTSPFCTFFSVANHELMEYYFDVYFYYNIGYGFTEYRRLFENLNCFLMQDMLRFLQSNDVNDHKARIFNAHLGSLYFTFVTFGVFKNDVPLTRHNFAQQAQRSWRTSLMSPMSANLAVVRYDCVDGDNDLLFLLNEKPLQIAGCEANRLCKLSLILERFSRFLDANCIEVFCTNY